MATHNHDNNMMTEPHRQRLISKRRNITSIGCCWLVFAASTSLVMVDAMSTTTTSLRVRPPAHRVVLESSASSEEQKATTTTTAQQQQGAVVPQPLVSKEIQQQTSTSNSNNNNKDKSQQHNESGNEKMQQEEEEEKLVQNNNDNSNNDAAIEITESMEAIANTKRLMTIGIVVSIIGLLFAMIFTAWQMSDYPDGFYAALCRFIIRGIGGFLYIVSSPFRSCLGLSFSARYAGHMPVSTMDYGYKDPSLQTL